MTHRMTHEASTSSSVTSYRTKQPLSNQKLSIRRTVNVSVKPLSRVSANEQTILYPALDSV